MMLAATASADPRPAPKTPLAALQAAPQFVDVQSSPQFTFLANQIAQAVTSPKFTVEDSFNPSVDGPTVLMSPKTIGAGKFILGVGADTTKVDFQARQNLVLGKGDDLVVQQLSYHVGLRQSIFFLIGTYGISEDFDATLLMPFVWTHARLDMSRGSTSADFEDGVSAQGDLSLRLKYYLEYNTSLGLTFLFPTGNPAKLSGTGDYWLALNAATMLPLGERFQLTGNVGVNFNMTSVVESEITYGIGLGIVMIPGRLGSAIEITGHSQLDDQSTISDTGVLTTDGIQPLFGLDFGRKNTVSLAVTFRVPLGYGLLALVGAIIPLTHPDFSPEAATPILGVGGTW